MVYQQRGFLVAEAACNVLAFFGDEDDAVERVVEDVVLCVFGAV